jgi:putative flippase GtrA
MSGERRSWDGAAGLPPSRHWLGFAASGAIAFCVDAVVLELGVRFLAMPPLVARLIAISVAMVAAWLSHRRFTFALTSRPTAAEFFRYATAAWATAGINYSCFAAILLLLPWFPRIPALVFASIVATFFSYLSMRYGVFRRSR